MYHSRFPLHRRLSKNQGVQYWLHNRDFVGRVEDMVGAYWEVECRKVVVEGKLVPMVYKRVFVGKLVRMVCMVGKLVGL